MNCEILDREGKDENLNSGSGKVNVAWDVDLICCFLPSGEEGGVSGW